MIIHRIPPIIGVVDEGWQIMRRATRVRRFASGASAPPAASMATTRQLMSMRGVFVAAGPAFRQSVTVPAFENIHIYNVLAQVLGVTPAPNDGQSDVAELVLR